MAPKLKAILGSPKMTLIGFTRNGPNSLGQNNFMSGPTSGLIQFLVGLKWFLMGPIQTNFPEIAPQGAKTTTVSKG